MVSHSVFTLYTIYFSEASSAILGVPQSEQEKEIKPLDDDYILACLKLIERAPTGGSAEDRRQRLLTWTQSTRAQRVTMFMTKPEMIEFAKSHGLNDSMVWSRNVPTLRRDLAKLLHTQEYGDDDDDGDNEVAAGVLGHIVEFLSAAFLRPQPRGKEEGQSKYTTQGHRNEKPFLKKFYEIMTENNIVDGESIEAIYCPGLVRQRGNLYLRDSSDGVAMLKYSDNEVKPVPIEVKSRCSPRTFARERQLIQQAPGCELHTVTSNTHTHDIVYADIDAVISEGDNTDEEDTNLRANPILHHLIPSSHELIQLLHHALTYRSASVFFIVGSNTDIMAIYRVMFPLELIAAYFNICSEFFKEDLKQLYVPGNKIPDVPDGWMDAFATSKLRDLKMDDKSFKFHLGLWRALNIDSIRTDKIKMQSAYMLPLPPCVRIIPRPIAFYNALKGGIDAFTYLLDTCQERLGIRTETNMACARLLGYFGILFHRINQWGGAKSDLSFYPTAAHARHANNERATFYESIKLLSSMFLSQGRRAAERTSGRGLDGLDAATINLDEILGVETPNEENQPRKSRRRSVASTPGPVQLEVAGFKTGTTPTVRETKTKNDVFTTRCEQCIGVYYGQLVPDPDPSTKKKGTSTSRIRRKCFICGTGTNYFCFGCRRYLCFSEPKIKDTKQPKFFTVDTPVLKQGQLQVIRERRNEDNDNEEEEEEEDDDDEEKKKGYKSVKETAKWTCYHAAHQSGWKSYLQLNREGLLNQAKGKKQSRRSSY